MSRIVVAGSENDTVFSIIDFTTATSPSVITPDPGFASGCRVDIDANTVAVGSVLTGTVVTYDVSVPSAPVKGTPIITTLAGIGAIAINGTMVAVGEWVNSFKARVILINFSNPQVPVIVGTAQTTLVNATIIRSG